MKKLSVVIITLNEERNIACCLKSVSKIADEIVVLDSFSTDNTQKICSKFDVKFHQHKFDGHIQQKNRAVALAKYHLVFALDADEAPNETLIKEIIRIKKDTKFDAYNFNRLTNYCGKWIKHSGWYPDKKLRIWNRTKGKWGGINPHDKVIMNQEVKIKYLKGDLLHYSYYSIQQHIDQINSFTNIGANEAFKKGRKSNLIIATVKSFWKFFRDYFINLGVLDGYYGFVVCSLSAQATFIKYLKLRELINNSK